MVGRCKRDVFHFILDKTWQRLQGWKNRLLSQAGKEILLKSVAQSLPVYLFGLFLLPHSLCVDLEAMFNRFWWRKSKGQERRVHWCSWERLCQAKSEGGLGFRRMHESNIAMLAKQAWRLVQQPSTLVSRLFKARYYPSSSFMLACKGSSPSYIWTSILAAKEFLCQSLVWRIGDGATVRVWEDSWLPILGAPRILSPVVEGLKDMKVHQLFSPSPVKT